MYRLTHAYPSKADLVGAIRPYFYCKISPSKL
jgi:hypothetical protein